MHLSTNIACSILSRGADNAPAILSQGETTRYADLRKLAVSIASRLAQSGATKGERVGILAENGAFSVGSFLGIIRAGLVAVPLPSDCPGDFLRKVCESAGLREILVSNRCHVRYTNVARDNDVVLIPEGQAVMCGVGSETLRFPSIDPGTDLAAIFFTSGSTGTPKGVMITHENIAANTADIVSYMGLTAQDRVGLVLPLHYCFGLSLLHSHLSVGGSLVLCNNFKLFPETTLQELQEHACTGFAGVPSTYQLLLRKSRFRELKFPALRWFQQAGGKLPNPQIQELRAAFPEVRYYLMYGQTEATARLSYLPPDKLQDKLGSIGKGLPSARLEVLKPDGSPVQPGSEEIGEIVASGPSISRGYWEDPEETAKYFRKGRLHTGDLARVDSDGYIYIVERERDMIKSGGNRVSAKEIEDVIAELPYVVETAVVGTPHDLLGEAIVAFVVAVDPDTCEPRNIQAHCRARLNSTKTPEQVIVLRSMPHNSAGKVMKQELKERLAAMRPEAKGVRREV